MLEEKENYDIVKETLWNISKFVNYLRKLFHKIGSITQLRH
jgi:hypothetical protein